MLRPALQPVEVPRRAAPPEAARDLLHDPSLSIPLSWARPLTRDLQAPRLAVVIHLHFVEFVNEFLEAMQCLREPVEVLAPLLALPDAPEVVHCNWESQDPADARTELLNLGLQAATGRYVAFLDYDDTLFPVAYELLMSRLHDSGASAAFASVRTVGADVHADFVHVSSHVLSPFRGAGLADLFRGNCCPIHSYLIDRAGLPEGLLRFDTSLVWEEDYDLLLRLCSAVNADFQALPHVIGDYYFKTDNSNTIWSAPVLSVEKAKAYEDVAAHIEMRRLLNVVASEVQRGLLAGDPDPALSIRGLLDALDRVPAPSKPSVA